jgi:DNA-binding Xre family transcriptional regulator
MKINTQKLDYERKRTGLGMMAFSRSLGMSGSTYGKILKSESTTLKTLARIATALYCDPKDLLTN